MAVHDEELAIQRQIRKWTILCAVLAVVAFAAGVASIWIAALHLGPGSDPYPLGVERQIEGLRNGCLLLMIAAAGCFARSKGVSEWLALLGIFSCLGFLIIACLDKKCRRCRQVGGRTANACIRCGAPMSLRWKPPKPR